jgi:hypothetical protein
VDVGWLTEMFFEIFPSGINHVAADLTAILLAETMEFVEPKGNWFTIPAEWKSEWVVDKVFSWCVFFIFIRSFNGWVECFVL